MTQDFYKNLLDDLYDGVYFVDQHRKILYWNRGAERLSGYHSEEVVGSYCMDDILKHTDAHGANLCKGMCPLALTIGDGCLHESELYLQHKDGRRVPVVVHVAPIREPGGEIIGAVEVFSDNTSKAAVLQRLDELEKMALLDPLTRLANRRYLEMNLHARMEELQRYKIVFGVLFFDVDHFKRVNDTYGHDIGDEVLKLVGATLAQSLRTFDMVGRWGGEEFVAIVRNVSPEHLEAVANRFRSLIEQASMTIGTETLRVTISVGATLSKADDTMEALLKRADRLLYQSKMAGRNRVSISLEA
jgi:diguanylate cyclase (GGDEF)-like protein/PAS domain S-box-containing protein